MGESKRFISAARIGATVSMIVEDDGGDEPHNENDGEDEADDPGEVSGIHAAANPRPKTGS